MTRKKKQPSTIDTPRRLARSALMEAGVNLVPARYHAQLKEVKENLRKLAMIERGTHILDWPRNMRSFYYVCVYETADLAKLNLDTLSSVWMAYNRKLVEEEANA